MKLLPCPASALLLAALPFGLAACGGGEDSAPKVGSPTTTEVVEQGGAGSASAPTSKKNVVLPATGKKLVRIPMATDGPKTLDPVQGSTTYDNRCCSQIYQTLVQYKYLARPLQLEPLLLTEMPKVSADGLTWDFELKAGVLFHDDACFPGGKGRELVTDDVFYSWRRLADPEYKYKNWWLVDGSIAGFNEYKDAQKKRVDAGQAFDYSAPIAGFKKIDDRRFQLTFTKAVQQFSWKLAMFQFSIVSREAVEKYGTGFSGHPVGTGPFMLESEDDWIRKTKLRLVKNPNYHEDYYPSESEEGDADGGFTDYAGVKLPIIDEIEITFFVQSQPMWLEFKAGNLDFSTVPEFGFDEFYKRSDRTLKASHKAKGISSFSVPLLDFIFRGFNMEDELVGGLDPKRRALRHAISLALDLDEMNASYYNSECIVYDGPIPPGLDGYPEGGNVENGYRGPNLKAARAKLVEAGYTIGPDGMVTDLPTIEYYTSAGATSEKMADLSMRNLEKVGIKLNPHHLDFSELIENINNKRAPFFSFAWGSDYPDGENNLALFYSPNVSPGSNHFNYSRPEYDALYESILTMPPGPERTAKYVEMRDMLIEDAPFAGSLARIRRYLIHPWLKNFKPTETFYNYMKYWDVDMSHKDRPKQN